MSRRDPIKIEIKEHTFRITAFDAFSQLRMFGDLQKEILPAIGGVLNVAFDKTEKETRSDAAAIEAFRDLSMRFDGKTLERWAGMLLDEEHITVELDGREARKLDKVTRELALDDFADILELMFHVGKVNFAAPLQRWASLTGLVQKLTQGMGSDGSTVKSSTSS